MKRRYTKAALLALAKQLLGGVLRHRSDGTEQIVLPWRALMRRPYSSERWGGERELELETLSRSLFLAACIVANEPECQVSGIVLREFYLQWLLRVAGDTKFRPISGRYDQATVEAALICISLEECSLLQYTSEPERELILAWLASYRHANFMPNNWQWFRITIDAFLQKHCRRINDTVRQDSLVLLEQMYAGDGWFRDGVGGRFDFYAAWGFQFYPLFMLRWGVLDEDIASLVRQRHDLFLNSYSHVFSRGGHMPCWGRSVIYRFAASATFSLAFMRDETSFDPGFARHLCAGNLHQFLETPWIWNSIPALGFYETNPALMDPYSCLASPMWCFKHFATLLLEDNNPFWHADANTGWWGKVERYDIIGTGMYVLHDEEHSHLIAPQQRGGDPRYEQICYSTDRNLFAKMPVHLKEP